jgi:hypothetical protein
LLGLVWENTQPLNYIIVIILLKSIEQPIFPFYHDITQP